MPQTLSILAFPNAEEAEAHGFNYNEWDTKPTPATIERAVLVMNGTQEGNPTVDFILTDAAGNKYVTMITAKLLAALARAAGR